MEGGGEQPATINNVLPSEQMAGVWAKLPPSRHLLGELSADLAIDGRSSLLIYAACGRS